MQMKKKRILIELKPLQRKNNNKANTLVRNFKSLNPQSNLFFL